MNNIQLLIRKDMIKVVYLDDDDKKDKLSTLIINSNNLPSDTLFEYSKKIAHFTNTNLIILHIMADSYSKLSQKTRIEYINDLFSKSSNNNCQMFVINSIISKQSMYRIIKKYHVINIASYLKTLHDTNSLEYFSDIKLNIVPLNTINTANMPNSQTRLIAH
ncbi:MAG: hypothetical protein ACI4PK_04345 [Oscillospiraceae bacterium]